MRIPIAFYNLFSWETTKTSFKDYLSEPINPAIPITPADSGIRGLKAIRISHHGGAHRSTPRRRASCRIITRFSPREGHPRHHRSSPGHTLVRPNEREIIETTMAMGSFVNGLFNTFTTGSIHQGQSAIVVPGFGHSACREIAFTSTSRCAPLDASTFLIPAMSGLSLSPSHPPALPSLPLPSQTNRPCGN